MNDTNGRSTPVRRRAVLGALAAGGTVALAGCGGGAGGGGTLPSPVAGDPEADLTLAVYEDFACPHCAHYNVEGFPGLESAYLESGEIRYEHHDLPIPVANPGSWEAANAGRAVQDRAGDGAFYTFAKRVFANYTQIPEAGPSLYESVADDLGLDGAAVRSAAVDRAYQETVEADRQAGQDAGVSSTPTFVLDGEIVAAGWSESVYGTVTDAIDGQLGTTA
ncbi:MAG: thioredoxin domain-containing protein [Haloarculaceae archaeon]